DPRPGRDREATAEGAPRKTQMTDLWKGRFATGLDPRIRAFTASLELDQRIALHDVRGSIAHARMLGRQGILPAAEASAIVGGLETIAARSEEHTSELQSLA